MKVGMSGDSRRLLWRDWPPHFTTAHDVDRHRGQGALGRRPRRACEQLPVVRSFSTLCRPVVAQRPNFTFMGTCMRGILKSRTKVQGCRPCCSNHKSAFMSTDFVLSEGHPKHNARRIARGEGGFALAAERSCRPPRNGQIAELDAPHERIAAAR